MSSSHLPTAHPLTHPTQAKWKEVWAQRLLSLSPANRLPRGFRRPQPGPKPEMVQETIGWLEHHKAAISKALHELTPLGPSLLTGRVGSRRKPSKKA